MDTLTFQITDIQSDDMNLLKGGMGKKRDI